jgi:hypothetical protein
MMFDPETELWLINQRHEELRRQAARDALARSLRRSRRTRSDGVFAWLARLLQIAWRPSRDVAGGHNPDGGDGSRKRT